MRKNLLANAHSLIEFHKSKEGAIKEIQIKLDNLVDCLQEFDIKLRDYNPIRQQIKTELYDSAYQWIKEEIATQHELIGILELIK